MKMEWKEGVEMVDDKGNLVGKRNDEQCDQTIDFGRQLVSRSVGQGVVGGDFLVVSLTQQERGFASA